MAKFEYVVEHDVPLVPAGYGSAKPPGHGHARYPFPLMAIHDSFFVEATEDAPMKLTLYRVACAARGFVNRNSDSDDDLKFACRMVGNGVRVWRIA